MNPVLCENFDWKTYNREYECQDGKFST